VTASAVWEPANEVERALRDAWLRNDNVAFLHTLATAPLYLPGFSEPDRSQRLLTWRHADRTHLLVFTSPEALFAQLTGVADGWRMTSVGELAASLPDPEWGVAISPNTPVGACLDPEELAELADAVIHESLFRPANVAEAAMFQAKQAGDPASYLDALMLSPVWLPVATPAEPDEIGRTDFPWLIEATDGATITAFTSDVRLAGVVSDQTPTVRVEMIAVALAWPDRSIKLTVNPGSEIAAEFTGDQVADLIEWARTLPLRAGDGPSGSAGPSAVPPATSPQPTDTPTPLEDERPPVVLEVDVALNDVDGYLSGAYRQISAAPRPAARAPEGAHVIRWRPAGTDDHSLVDGAQMFLGGPNGDRLVATYQAELDRWMPAVADLLRGNAPE
jgi:hypothetical protein